jgi:secreted Zn-dependent insulinase-like peptidase
MKFYYTSKDIEVTLLNKIDQNLKVKNQNLQLPEFNNFIPNNI